MTINKLFPGRPNYVGPTSGPFALLHHSELWEWSHDVMERVDYVRLEKPEHEQKIRLHNMIYLGGCAVFKGKAGADWNKAWVDWNKAGVDWNKAGVDLSKARVDWNKAEANWNKVNPNADAKILAYIKKHIPNCAWGGKELIFPEARGVK